MSRKLQFVAALLILSSLSLGTLNALPLNPAPATVHTGGVLVAVMDWAASLFSWGKPHGSVPKHPRSKIANQLDPDGHH
jgi:hypothetical protein